MATLKQLEANRRNAMKSTGPRTPEGKARSLQNTCKLPMNGPQAVLVAAFAERCHGLFRWRRGPFGGTWERFEGEAWKRDRDGGQAVLALDKIRGEMLAKAEALPAENRALRTIRNRALWRLRQFRLFTVLKAARTLLEVTG